MNELSRTLCFAAVAALLVPVVACENKPIDQKTAEADVKKLMADTNKLTLTSVSCPPNQSGKAGTSFKCTGTDELGTTGSFTVNIGEKVMQVQADGIKIMDLKALGDRMEASMKAKSGQDADVQCPAKNVMIKKGAKFSCDAKIGDKTTKIPFIFADDDGSLTVDAAAAGGGGGDHPAPPPAASADHPAPAASAPHAPSADHAAPADHAAEHH